MLKLIGVNKVYKKRVIFGKENFSISNNGIFLIQGKNGSGKSTLFNIIAKITPYKGKVFNDNIDSMSYLFQQPHLVDYLTIKEHFELFGIDKAILEKVNLIEKLEEYPSSLSSGEKQRIGLLLSVYSDVNLVLLDEPFANIDKKNIELISSFIKEQSNSKLILITSHDYNNLIDYNGRILIKDKRIIVKEKNNKFEKGVKESPKRKISIWNKCFRKNKKSFFKFYFFIFMMFLSIMGICMSETLIFNNLQKDINNGVDYNKFYLKKCNKVIDQGFKINKCTNPTLDDLENINYGYNYDFLLNHLYDNNQLRVMNNNKIKLKYGRYPSNVSEVIASDKYKIGDTIILDVKLVYKGEKTEFYKQKIELKIVGIYHSLFFYNQDEIYLDYYLLEEYFKNEYFVDSDISLYEYYKNLEIENYKYLSFERIDNSNIVFVGEKYEYYKSFDLLMDKVGELVLSLVILVTVFFTINFFRMYKSFLERESKNVSFLLVNSFNKSRVVNNLTSLFTIPIIFLGLILFLLNFIIKIKYLMLIMIMIFFMLLYIVGYTYVFFNRNKLEKYMKVQI